MKSPEHDLVLDSLMTHVYDCVKVINIMTLTKRIFVATCAYDWLFKLITLQGYTLIN